MTREYVCLACEHVFPSDDHGMATRCPDCDSTDVRARRHLDDAEIASFIDGRQDRAARALTILHLAECDFCRTLMVRVLRAQGLG